MKLFAIKKPKHRLHYSHLGDFHSLNGGDVTVIYPSMLGVLQTRGWFSECK